MFLTLIKNQEVLDRALVGSKLTGLDDAEWITIYFLEKMLGQIAVCLRQLEGEKAVTINYVLPLILQLKKKWKAELNFTPDFGFLINFAIENLEDRFKFCLGGFWFTAKILKVLSSSFLQSLIIQCESGEVFMLLILQSIYIQCPSSLKASTKEGSFLYVFGRCMIWP